MYGEKSWPLFSKGGISIAPDSTSSLRKDETKCLCCLQAGMGPQDSFDTPRSYLDMGISQPPHTRMSYYVLSCRQNGG
jgi:hypothetical protein